jgi:hypothetical protein
MRIIDAKYKTGEAENRAEMNLSGLNDSPFSLGIPIAIKSIAFMFISGK